MSRFGTNVAWMGINPERDQKRAVAAYLEYVTGHFNLGLYGPTRNLEIFRANRAKALVFAGPLNELAYLKQELGNDVLIFRPITLEAEPETKAPFNRHGCQLWPTGELELVKSCTLKIDRVSRPTGRPLRLLNLTFRKPYSTDTLARLNQACRGPVEMVWPAEQQRLKSTDNIIRLRQQHEADGVILHSHMWDFARTLGQRGESVVLGGVWTWPDGQLHYGQPQFVWCQGVNLDTVAI